MARWASFPHAAEFDLDTDEVQRRWARLHAGDAEPLPQAMATLRATLDDLGRRVQPEAA